MRIRMLFAHDGDPSNMPNAVAVSDEYLEDAAGLKHWDEEIARVRAGWGDDAELREAFVDVPDLLVRRLFDTPDLPVTEFQRSRPD